MDVLTWNLFHGRARPPARRELRAEFTAALAGWAWDVALLQEVPPWWPPELARACAAEQRTVLTSRNALLGLRRFVAERAPDLIKSGGGGANAILVRGARIAEHRSVVLRRRPERRVCHAVRLDSGLWCANLHAQVRPHTLTRADIDLAARAVLGWAGDAPVLLGGDLNVRDPAPPGFDVLGGHGVDHVFGRGVAAIGPARVLERGALSDHAPVLVPAQAVAASSSPS
jgi:endonuclease/exonuclease/phosphatase family metal-dependent hydrolase